MLASLSSPPPVTSLRHLSRQRSRSRVVVKAQQHSAHGDAPPPATAAAVVSWAHRQFLAEVAQQQPNINLAKACMLVALEEEAAKQLGSAPSASARTSATASTWSLQRLDALAAEVVALIELEDNAAAAFVLQAVNTVLFTRHGYSACNRYGASADSELSVVLEDGPGSVAALTILYIEVCTRLGFNCGVKVVEDGRYCLVWPQPPQPPQQQQQQVQQTLLSVGGDACVIDVYGLGALLPVREACELFELTPQELLAGSSRRELLNSMLTEMQTAHWSSAIGCAASPALMTPLSAGTAVRHAVSQLNGAGIERAAAAAAKRVALLPHDRQAQLDLALLCYFAGRYEDAWLELGCYLEQLKAASVREQQQQQQGATAAGDLQEQPAAAAAAPPPGGGTVSAGSSSSSSAVNRVSELHAAIQSMLIGGAVPPAAASSPAQHSTAAEAALASAADENGDDGDAAGGEQQQQQQQQQEDQELSDVLLLFQKLQLELMMAADSTTGGNAEQAGS